ncbi:3'-5' RNA exonuclease complex component [Coemansia sp. RSA 2599]|nr:3'-5' RNA exonuclease complex component [Coemansia sp. RSA 2598]KAJ1829246.1 3'-5' RNA exonuclease complex component [Coemansia sp. RSA 2599]
MMQSRLCTNAFRLSLASTKSGLRTQRLICRQYSSSSQGADTQGGEKKYPELEDILGSPAKSFKQLIDQLETLIKHPNPPRSYADALAKTELRRTDYRDLTAEIKKEDMDMPRKHILRQRPRLLRDGRRIAEQSEDIIEDSGGKTTAGGRSASNIEEIPPLSEQTAANLGITPEQQERRRIWMTKIKGYNAFRKNLISMDTLLGSIDGGRKPGGAVEPDFSDNLRLDDNYDLDLKATQSLLDKEDAKFEELIRRSWKAYDEDMAGAGDGASETKLDAEAAAGPVQAAGANGSKGSSGPAPLASHKGKTTPPGARSFHTGRLLSKADTSSTSPKSTPRSKVQRRVIKEASKFRKGSGKPDSNKFGRAVKGIFRQVVVPPKNIVSEHVRSDNENAEDIYIPIDATVSTGDIIEIRVNNMQAINTPFTNLTHINGILQRITGRFHFNIIHSDGVLAGGRETRIGFVARGTLFDEELLKKSGAKKADIERILEYGKEINDYIEKHGEVAITHASEAEKLYRQQRLALQTAANVNSNMMKAGQPSMAGCEASEDLSLLPASAPPGSKDSGEPGQIGDEEVIDGEDSIIDVVLRVFPRVLRIFRQQADQLMRSRLFDLDNYWELATKHNKKYVTVDALAELIFGGKGKEPIGEVERLAVYTYLSKDVLHYIPDSDYLFVTNRFTLRAKEGVEEFMKTRELIRSDSPEFRSFTQKARRLINYAYSKDPYSPVHSSLDPDDESFKKSLHCDVSGWSSGAEPFKRAPPNEPLLTEDELEKIVFTQDDLLFIKAICAYVFEAGPGYTFYDSPYGSLAPYIIKKTRFYTSCTSTTATSFLIDIGVWPSTFNPMLNARYIPLGELGKGSAQMDRKELANSLFEILMKSKDISAKDQKEDGVAMDNQKLLADSEALLSDVPAVKDSILTRKADEKTGSFGVMDKTEFYNRDICEDIRHDFGDLPVFTVDDAETRDIDDGFSLEDIKTASGEVHKWVHVHIADPTNYVHPGHIAAAAAFDTTSTLYLVENIYSMFSKKATERILSLAPRSDGKQTPTMTFSFRIDEATGDIADYKVRPGLIRNITAVSYKALNQYLSFDEQPEDTSSLEKIRVTTRNSTIMHPFATGSQDIEIFREPKVKLSEDQIKQFLGIQRIASKHYSYRINNGGFTHLYGERKIYVDSSTLSLPGKSIERPVYLMKPHMSPDRGSMVYPKIISTNSSASLDPAHAIVSELMIISGRIAARYACEHGSAEDDSGVNSSGVVVSEGKGVPFLFRSQEPPTFEALSGVRMGLPMAFDGLTREQADSASEVYKEVQRLARENRGYVGIKHFDEIRHMMNPSRLSTEPGPHSIMGLMDKSGYARATSPLRRAEDLIVHWQIKAQLLAERGNGKDKSPWYWDRYSLEVLSSKLYLRSFLADKVMANSEEFWIYCLIRRMESEARRGCLQLPPSGFYDANDPSYYDLPWAYYDPRKPGPLIWTAYVDNRDESREFITTRIGVLNSKAILPIRPVDPALLPFAGTRIRVQVVFIDPAQMMMVVKMAPEEYQFPETPKFWRSESAINLVGLKLHAQMMPPANIQSKDALE